MKTLTTESTQYRAPKCEIFACETMTPLCVSGAVTGSFKTEDYEEEDYGWQIK